MLVYEYKWDATKQQTKTGLSESCSHWGDTDPTDAAAFGFGPGFRVSFWLKICHRVPAIYVTPLFNTATNSQLPLACMSLFRGPNSVTRVLLNLWHWVGSRFSERKKETKKEGGNTKRPPSGCFDMSPNWLSIEECHNLGPFWVWRSVKQTNSQDLWPG